MSVSHTQLTIRRAEASDDEQILALLQASLGWVPDQLFATFFDWKHRQNPFGESPSWVATDGQRVVGFRTFLRWEFEYKDRIHRAVRAVDTATHPDYQGRGIFSKLTVAAIDEMRPDGIEFVFNTPNENSRPGYLKMGWKVVGRLPISVRIRSVASSTRMLRARVAADKWSTDCRAGIPVLEALSEDASIKGLLAVRNHTTTLRTRRSPEFLRWRYGFGPLRYRAILAGDSVRDGLAIVRLRNRGTSRELVICDELLPSESETALSEITRTALHTSGADYALRIGGAAIDSGFYRLPRQGPILTWREIRKVEQPRLADWGLTMGDVELF
jgi:GNAT superfamily N-acetyltransferase